MGSEGSLAQLLGHGGNARARGKAQNTSWDKGQKSETTLVIQGGESRGKVQNTRQVKVQEQDTKVPDPKGNPKTRVQAKQGVRNQKCKIQSGLLEHTFKGTVG